MKERNDVRINKRTLFLCLGFLTILSLNSIVLHAELLDSADHSLECSNNIQSSVYTSGIVSTSQDLLSPLKNKFEVADYWVDYIYKNRYNLQEINDEVVIHEDGQIECVLTLSDFELDSDIRSLLNSHNAQIVKELPTANLLVVKLDKQYLINKDSNFLLSALNTPDIEIAEPNILRQIHFNPNDDYYWSDQWNLRKINMPAAWDIERGSSSVYVAVIDTGLEWYHDDIEDNYGFGYDWYAGDSDPDDWDGHGTFCSGLIAAVTNNDLGVAGIADVTIIAERVGTDAGITIADEVAGINHAVSNGADILSMSFGGAYSSTEASAISAAASSGVVMVASSGNNGYSYLEYPAKLPGVIGVGATDSYDSRASWSNYGTGLDLVAPGVDITSTYIYNGYAYGDGTSFSAPHVAAVAALLKSAKPTSSVYEIETAMFQSAVDLGSSGFDSYYGYGRVDALAALNYLTPPDVHDLRVSLDVASSAQINEATDIQLTFQNLGTLGESNIGYEITIEGATFVSSTLASISEGQTIVTSYGFTPTQIRDYSIRVNLNTVPAEVNVADNTDSATLTGFDLRNYLIENASYFWFDACKYGVNLGLSGDDVYVSQDLPFSFYFYKDYFDVIYLSSNGFLTFESSTPNLGITTFPNLSLDYVIAPFWNDMKADNNIYCWETEDFIVFEYKDYKFSNDTLAGDFEVILFSTGEILFQYKFVNNDDNSTIGVNFGLDSDYYTIDTNSSEYLILENFGKYYTYEGVDRHDLSTFIDTPEISTLKLSQTYSIIVTVFNIGTNNETDVELRLLINGVIQNWEIIANLSPGENYSFTNYWTPVDYGKFTFEAYAPPMTLEVLNSTNCMESILYLTKNYQMEGTDYTEYYVKNVGTQLDFSAFEDIKEIILPFSFSFYHVVFSSIYVSPQGWISFNEHSALPDSPLDLPNDFLQFIVAPFWVNLAVSGPYYDYNKEHIFYRSTADYFAILFDNIYDGDGISVGSFEIILHRSGEIVFQYLSIVNDFNSTKSLNFGPDTRFYNHLILDLDDVSNLAVQFDFSVGLVSPILIGEDDLFYDLGVIGNTLSWTCFDENPSFYTIKKNETIIFTAIWGINSTIIFSVDGLLAGIYLYEIEVFNLYGFSTIDKVNVTVNDPPPQLFVTDFYLDVEAIGNSIIWYASDYNPGDYELVLSGTIIASGSWISNVIYESSVDWLDVGIYQFYLTVRDVALNERLEIFSATIVDVRAPVISNVEDFLVYQYAENVYVNWYVEERARCNYQLSIGGTVVDTGMLDGNGVITTEVDTSTLEQVRYYLTVTDEFGNSNSERVFITIQAAPDINSGFTILVGIGSFIVMVILVTRCKIHERRKGE